MEETEGDGITSPSRTFVELKRWGHRFDMSETSHITQASCSWRLLRHG